MRGDAGLVRGRSGWSPCGTHPSGRNLTDGTHALGLLPNLVGPSERSLLGSLIERTRMTGMGGDRAGNAFARLRSEAPYHIKPGVCIRSKDGDLALCRDDPGERSDVHLMCYEHEGTRSAQPIPNAVA
jgi:hypothetical protein